MRVAAYLRVSTSLQADEGNSLDAQLRRCVDYARLRQWPGVLCLYVDAGISGTSMTKRPAMQQLFGDIEAGRIDAVVVTKLDRAFRNVRDAAESLDRIRKAGATFAILDLQVDTSTAAGEMMFNLLASFGQFESRRIGERIHETNRHLVAGGRHVGGNTPPFGYLRGDDKQLIVHEPEAAVVRRIFDDYVTNPTLGAGSLARRLNDEGIGSPTGRLWDSTLILRILRNPVYNGEVAYGRGAAPRHSQWSDDTGRVRAEGRHEALVDRATWEAALQKMLRRRTPGRDPSPAHVYGGLLWCGHCRARVWSTFGGGERRTIYVCANLSKGGRAHCPESKRIYEHVLNDLVTPAVEQNLKRVGASGWTPRTQPRKVASDRDRSWHEERLRRLNRLYVDLAITESEYMSQRSAVQEELRQLDRPASPAPAPIDRNAAADYAAFVADSDVSMERKRAVAASVVERIVVTATEVTIHFRDLQYRGWRTEETIRRPLPHERGRGKRGRV